MTPNVYVTYCGTVDTAYSVRDVFSIPQAHAVIASKAVSKFVSARKRIPKSIIVTIDLLGNVKVERANWKHFDN